MHVHIYMMTVLKAEAWMGQLNMNTNEAFERNLSRFMKLRGIATKSEAIRVAIQEGVENALEKRKKPDFDAWLGAGLGPGLNPNPKFASDDDLWKKG